MKEGEGGVVLGGCGGRRVGRGKGVCRWWRGGEVSGVGGRGGKDGEGGGKWWEVWGGRGGRRESGEWGVGARWREGGGVVVMGGEVVRRGGARGGLIRGGGGRTVEGGGRGRGSEEGGGSELGWVLVNLTSVEGKEAALTPESKKQLILGLSLYFYPECQPPSPIVCRRRAGNFEKVTEDRCPTHVRRAEQCSHPG